MVDANTDQRLREKNARPKRDMVKAASLWV
jgi:hypothetical protein